MTSDLRVVLDRMLREVTGRFAGEWPRSLKVGVIGAGNIAREAHLPAYRQHGVDVRGVFDVDTSRMERFSDLFTLPKRYGSMEAVLGDEEVDVIDVAVPPDSQAEVVRAALEAGKDVICQKQIGTSTSESQGLVRDARRFERRLVPNMQLRYCDGVEFVKQVLASGLIGRAEYCELRVDVVTEFDRFPRLRDDPQFEVRAHSIHYLDTLRFMFAELSCVGAVAGSHGGQGVRGPTRTVATFKAPDGLPVLVAVNHQSHFRTWGASFVVEASQGAVTLHMGTMLNYPYGPRDVVEIVARTTAGVEHVSMTLPTRWIPDAFIGPLWRLSCERSGDSPSYGAADDFLRTLALVDDVNELLNGPERPDAVASGSIPGGGIRQVGTSGERGAAP